MFLSNVLSSAPDFFVIYTYRIYYIMKYGLLGALNIYIFSTCKYIVVHSHEYISSTDKNFVLLCLLYYGDSNLLPVFLFF